MFLKYLSAKEKVVKKLDRDCLERLERDFFKISQDSFKKWFQQWLKPPLLTAMIGGEPKIAQMFAEWVLSQGTYLFIKNLLNQSRPPIHKIHPGMLWQLFLHIAARGWTCRTVSIIVWL